MAGSSGYHDPSRKWSLPCRLHQFGLRMATAFSYQMTGTHRVIAELNRCRTLSPAELEALSMARLRAVLAHVFEFAPWHKAIAERARLTPEMFQRYEDLRRLPIMSRQDVQTHLEEMRSLRPPFLPVKRETTAGSTGQPVIMYIDSNHVRTNWGIKSWHYELCGYRIGEPVAVLTGSRLSTEVSDNRKAQVRDRLLRNAILLDFHGITREGLFEGHERLLKHDPTLLFAFPRSLALYSQFLRETGLRRPNPRGAQVTGEPLMPEERELCEDVLGCPVFNRYGCHEVGMVAHDCREKDGLHVSPLACIVEIVDENGEPCPPGQHGDVLLTGLNNYAMPFIRYRVGDIASWADGPCACGWQGPRLKEVTGRTGEFVRSPGGKIIFSTAFSGVMQAAGGAAAFQVVQETLEDITVRFVPCAGADPEVTKAKALERIHKRLDPGFRVTFEVLESEIPPTPSGKHRFVVSKLQAPAIWADDSRADAS